MPGPLRGWCYRTLRVLLPPSLADAAGYLVGRFKIGP